MTCHGVNGPGSGSGMQQASFPRQGGNGVPLATNAQANYVPPAVAELQAYLRRGETPPGTNT